jgi:hypothetical protein
LFMSHGERSLTTIKIKVGHSLTQKGPLGIERGQHPKPGTVLIRTL